MLLNHDVPIPPEAVAIHGYTQEYLRRHGQAPSHVHAAFRDYARDYCMKNPFVLIKVRSERAIRLALVSSVAAAIMTPIGFYLAAFFHTDFDLHGGEIPILITGLIFAPITFILVGYLVVGIAWLIELWRR
jgi:hypothetical protein